MRHGDRGGGAKEDTLRRRSRRQYPGEEVLCFPPPPPNSPFHLLEVTIISAQDLQPACCRTKAYAEAWVDPEHKLRTGVDSAGRTNPTWNDKFVFRVDAAFLRSDTAGVTVEIRRARSLLRVGPHPVLGTARLIVSTLDPRPETRFVALQVRRPASLRPQGILNMGVALVDGYMRGVPLYADMGSAQTSAFALRDLASRTPSLQRQPSTVGGVAAERGFSGEMDKSGEVGRWVLDKEREALQLKLEKWRTELSPAVADPHHKSSEKKTLEKKREEREGSWLACFSSGGRYGGYGEMDQ
ncbi:hypothetical protein HPP92_025522 [Vanilla planifolia]|uniref:C2 domain-containing protein n=1 Tax=Vanilla planifolia TaxID=51239 RepID=A0A835PMX5_VANPL|nr:hypothetical protein HPP92_025522 [Vanilla planifolia]